MAISAGPMLQPSIERALTRTIAVVCVLLGLSALVVSVRVFPASIPVGLIFVAFGIAALAMSRYAWKQTSESLHTDDERPWFGGALITRRDRLAKTAQLGCALTIGCTALFCFGHERPLRLAAWPLMIGAIALLQIGRNSASRDSAGQDWSRVPAVIRTSCNEPGHC